MKKEAINTFQQGLVYDLNPITTPNNVLTDNVNGTFITFNGDELALQNDAGNTKILIDGETDKYVQLTDWFYPLGVKEYGGVLYIVSGYDILKNIPVATSSTLYQEDLAKNGWYVGDIFKAGTGYATLYDYTGSGEEFRFDPIILEGDIESQVIQLAHNFYISNKDRYPQYKYTEKKIEFGSYPSPEFSGQTTFKGKTDEFYDETILYNPMVINDSEFKSGRYIVFAENNPGFSADFSNITHFTKFGEKIVKFYKIKLWQQLNNGMLDLTDDIDEKYRKFVNKATRLTEAITGTISVLKVENTDNFPDTGKVVIGGAEFIYTSKTSTSFIGNSTTVFDYPAGSEVTLYGYQALSDHWISETSFVYFCPNQFKGKLSISLEIEGIGEFKRVGATSISLYKTPITELKVVDTTDFPDSGSLYLNSEVISFSAKTANAFTIPQTAFESNSLIGDRISLMTTVPTEIVGNTLNSIAVFNVSGFPDSGSVTIIGETIQIFNYNTRDIGTNSLIGDPQVLTTIQANSKVISNNRYTTLTEAIGKMYKILANIYAKNTNDVMTVPSVHLESFSIPGVDTSKFNMLLTQYTKKNDIIKIELDKLPESLCNNRTINYSIIPNVNYYNGTTNVLYDNTSTSTNYWKDFPNEYKENYIINGSRLISTITENVRFVLGGGACNYTTGNWEYTKVYLTDVNGNYLDTSLQITTTKYVLLLDGAAAVGDEVKIGSFTLNANAFPDVVTFEAGYSLNSTILELFKQTSICVANDLCRKALVTITVDKPVPENGLIVKQFGEVIEVVPNSYAVDGNTAAMSFRVATGNSYTVAINYAGYIDTDITMAAIYEDYSMSVCCIADVTVFTTRRTNVNDPETDMSVTVYDYEIQWDPGTDVVGINLPTILNGDSVSVEYDPPTYYVKVLGLGYENSWKNLTSYMYPVNIDSNTQLVTDYANIVNKANYVVYNGVVFKKSYADYQ